MRRGTGEFNDAKDRYPFDRYELALEASRFLAGLRSRLTVLQAALGLVRLRWREWRGHAHAGVPATEFRAQVTAATLLFRTLTYGIQIPLGALTYLIWQHKRSWRRSSSPEAAPVTIEAVR